MSDSLIYPQLLECGRLAMPEGLKELMSDISREVLRAQPTHLYKFIADYLSALLVTRENISIACRMCGDVCKNICHRALVDELKDIGFDDEDATSAADIITKYFSDGGYKEACLMVKLLNETKIEPHQLPELKIAIENTFNRQKKKNILSEDLNQEKDDISRAVNHTMRLYEQSSPTPELSCKMAQKIQAAYRAYGVRRSKPKGASSSQNSESDSCLCNQVSVRPFYDPVESFKAKHVQLSDSESDNREMMSQTETDSIYLASKDMAEVAEIEHATIDYTIDDPVVVSKPVVYNKTSIEDLNICNIKDSMDEIESSYNDEASVADVEENIITELEEVDDEIEEIIEECFENQKVNDKIEAEYNLEDDIDSFGSNRHDFFTEMDNVEYITCEHDDCPQQRSRQETISYDNLYKESNKEFDESFSKDDMGEPNEKKLNVSKIKLSIVSKQTLVGFNSLNTNLDIIVEDNDEYELPVTDSTHAYVNEMTQFDKIIQDNKLVDKVIGEARKSIALSATNNEGIDDNVDNIPVDFETD